MSTWSDYLVAEIGSLKKTAQSAELGHAPSVQGDGAREIISGFLSKALAPDVGQRSGRISVWSRRPMKNSTRQAIREERRKGNPAPNGHELLKQIRARKATKH